MKIDITRSCCDFESFRAARVKSLFNVDDGSTFRLEAELPIEGREWSVGLVVGPSGTGKTSIGREIFGEDAVYQAKDWAATEPIIDAIAPEAHIDEVTAALAAVGLGSVPSWLRPYSVLSNGEKFRADLARIVCERPARVVVDEFTSVVDRQIARIGALAFGKAWRRTGGQCVLLSCHYDIVRWLRPDWVYDTGTGRFTGRRLRRPPFIHLDIHEATGRHWSAFEPHHYLKLPQMIAATHYVGAVDGELVAHVAFSTRPGLKEARACRLVIMPEWQGAGIGMRFLNHICGQWRRGLNRYAKPMPTLFHTSHPGLIAALRRDALWTQVSANLFGGNRARSAASILRAGCKTGGGYGGHFRAVQGFRYIEGC